MNAAGPRLLLHVGAMKTGTTYLQHRLTANAEALAAQGWWVPDYQRVVRAVREILSTDGRGPAPEWVALMEEARAWRGHGTVVSMEFLSYARRRYVPDVVGTTAGLDLRVVLTVRDTVRALPSQWQTLTRNTFGFSWPEFATAVRNRAKTGPAPGTASFRRTQDLPRMIVAWASAVEQDRLAVMTVPTPDQPRDLLWDRFLGALGVDPGTVTAPAAFDNPQLGYGTCELLRRVNRAGLDAEDPERYRKVVRRLTHLHVDALREGQSRPRMDRATAEWAARFNRRTLRAVERHGTLVGAATDLPTDLTGHPVLDELDPGPTPEQVPDAEVRAAAEVVRRATVQLCEQQELALPAELAEALPADLDDAVGLVATLLGVAMTGDVSHRPTPRPPRDDASTVATEE